MFKSFAKVYLILFLILLVLLVAIRLFPKHQEVKNEQTITPTLVESGTKVYTTLPPIVVPTSTGGSEEIATSEAIAAIQKQALRKRTPFAENVFNVSFDYSTDNFIVILAEPKDINKQVFADWLKENYPAIPLNKFIFK